MKTAILLNSDDIGRVDEKDVICADGGYRYAEGKNVIAVVGDLDSLRVKPENVTVVKYPLEKNMTDGELAVRYAAEKKYNEIVIYGAAGGRLDHVLGNISLLKLARSLGIKATVSAPDFKLFYCNSELVLDAEIGQSVSVFAYGGDAVVENSEGLYYPLTNLRLQCFCTRGISNRATANKVKLKLKSGEIIVFRFENKIKNIL